ncbi:hypothetical protein PX52LOC_07787 [Limnoglobus roseus]|uniref:Uncharacterized protein n=1 Tax=Limnoglobus roseus TaxID=2598579 RepID=A0A5C1ANW0_9BACT|nr:hypothetical protein PX52LOC_07787 [Limnoglobus roseus]
MDIAVRCSSSSQVPNCSRIGPARVRRRCTTYSPFHLPSAMSRSTAEKRADVSQGSTRLSRTALRGFDELPPNVGPATEVSGSGPVDRVVAGIGVGVHEAPIPFEELGGVLFAPAGGEVEVRVGMGRIAEVDPSVGGAGGLQQLPRGLVGVDRERRFHPGDHEPEDGIEQRGALHDQVAQAGAIHGPTLPCEDLFLAVQGQMIDILPHDDLRHESVRPLTLRKPARPHHNRGRILPGRRTTTRGRRNRGRRPTDPARPGRGAGGAGP